MNLGLMKDNPALRLSLAKIPNRHLIFKMNKLYYSSFME